MTGLEKAAVLLKGLPAGIVEKVLRQMDAKHAGVLAAEIAKLNKDTQHGLKLSSVLDEAAKIIEASKSPPVAAQAETPVAAAPEASAGKGTQVDIRLEEKPPEKPPVPAIDLNAEPLKALGTLPPNLLAQALDSENSRTISLLIHRLDIAIAGEIYKRLSPAKRKEVSARFTEQPNVNDELLKRIAQGVLRKCQALREAPQSANAEEGGREKRVAALLRGLERNERTEMLTLLGQSDAELVGKVKAMLYQFEDIERMEGISVQKLLAEVDVKSLALAMIAAPTGIENKILGNLSKRAQTSLKEEIDLLGKVPSARVKQGRQAIVEAIQRLDERGDLILIES